MHTMKFAKSILMGTGAVVLAGLILALLAPRAAHAVVATAVQVENTIASPVVSQSILPGTPFIASCISSTPGYCFLLPDPPAGYTFHATYFSAAEIYGSAPTVPDAVSVQYVSNGQAAYDYEIAAVSPLLTTASHPVDWYLDPGKDILVNLSDANAHFTQEVVTLSGYLTH